MVILIIAAVSVVAVTPGIGKAIRLGIDLRGGAELQFKIDTTGLSADQISGITTKTVDIVRSRIDPNDQKGLIIQSKDQQRIVMQLPGFSQEGTKDIIALATNLGRLEFRITSKQQDLNKIQVLKSGKPLPNYAWYPYALSARTLSSKGNAALREGILVGTNDGYEITGDLLQRVWPTTDETGGPAVGFEMKPEGAKRFARMTSEHVGDEIAIILNGEIYSAPVVRSTITSSGIISGIETAKEVEMLVKVLNSGSLKAPLILESEQYVGPSVGEATIHAAIWSGVAASIAVLAFMMIYYLFAGAVADFAVTLNVVILMAFMALSQSTLTLPGIAGIVLTIGMAVDANVLIFERFREERRLGREVPVALRLGYEKAFSAIFDSNLTTFATAAILYVYGTGPVRGFAITLSAGILISFFTAVFVTRVVFELLVRYGVVKDLKMLQLLTRTSIPFMRLARYTIVFSAALIIGGMWLFLAHYRELLDIDLTGGSVARLTLTRPLSDTEVRDRITAAGFPDAAVQALADQKATAQPGEVSGTEEMSKLIGKSMTFAIRIKLQEKAGIQDFESRIGAAFADAVPQRFVVVTEQNVTQIKAKNDPFVNGVRVEVKLAEALSGEKIAADVAKAGLPTYELKLYAVDEVTGAVKEMPAESPKLSLFAVREVGLDDKGLMEKLGKTFAIPNPFPEAVYQVGSVVAKELWSSAVLATLLSMLFMIVYIWFRFNGLRFGLAAVIALFHDIPVALGALAIADSLSGTAIGQALLFGDLKINLPVIAAVLTLMGYSINDTIVVFDRIRENMRLKTKSDWVIIDGSINQTLSRTVLTSFTVFLVLLFMYVFGGPGIHAFSFVMLVGVVTGTYSSIFIASPILLIKHIFKGEPVAQKATK
jgi:SecD/SecF fusion protein